MANEAEIIASNLLSSAIEYKRLYDTTKKIEYREKEQRLRRIAENVKLLAGSSSASTVNSFNGRTGAITLTSADVTGALGYVPPTILDGLNDVTISAPANAQVLTYNSTTLQWENQTPTAGGGGDMLKATYDVDNSGVVDNAESISIVGRNSTGSTLYKGTIVYISGSTGNLPNFVKAQANVEATSAGTFGVVRADISNNSNGYVTTIGFLDNLDTRSTATHPFTDVTLADGDTIYLHPTIAGYITNVKPSAPNHLVYVGKVTRTSPTNGTIVYRIQNGYELDEIHDVAISSKANNDLLVYESASSLWKNKTFAAIFGGTPLVSVPTLNQVTTAGNTTTNAITVGGLTVNTNLIYTDTVNGRVGIGTIAPVYKVDVRGTTVNDAISTQVGLNFNPVPSPTTGSLALVVSAGNVDLGIHYYLVTFTTALGETNPYFIGSITTIAGSQQVTVTIPVSTDSRVTGRKLYRTKASAGGNYWETFNLATIANNTATSYVDNIADASLTGTNGTGFFQVNTTYRALSVNGTQSLVVDLYATYLGVGAGGGVTSGGGNNTFIGYNAGRFSYTSNQSVAIGNLALAAQTAGGNNIGIGSQAGGITTGSNNIVIGRNSGVNINTGSENTIIGSFTWNLGTATGKTGNTGLGYNVGSNNTGNNNLFLGYQAGYLVTGSNQILLDTIGRADEASSKSAALIYGVTNGTVTSQTLSLGGGGNVGVGTLSPTYKLDVQGTTLNGSTISAQGAFNINPLAAPSAIGGFTLSAGTNLGVGQYYYFVVYVTALGETSGSNTLLVTTTTGNTTVNLTGIPVSSDARVTARKLYRTKVGGTVDNQWFLATISDNVTTTYTDSIADASLTGVGLQSYKVNTTARYFTVSGTQVMVIDGNLTALGRSAGNAIITSNATAVRTVLIGAQAGQNITTGTSNVIVGVAGGNVTTGSDNSLFGDLAGFLINSGYGNTIIGAQAGRFLNSGYQNIFIGQGAGSYLANGSTQVTTAFQNIAIGRNVRLSTINDSNSIIIGDTALGLGSNTTVIGNSSTVTTAIYGNLLLGTTTTTGQKLQVAGNVFIKGSDSLSATKVFEVQTGDGTSIMDFRNATYAFFGCGQGGGSASGFIFNYSNTSYTQFSGYNYGAGSGAYKPILMDTDIAGRGQGIFVNFGTSTLLPPNSDTEFAVRGRTADATSFIVRFRESGNTDRFTVRCDGALFTNTLQGYSGSVAVTTPTGTKTFTITNGLITNVV